MEKKHDKQEGTQGSGELSQLTETQESTEPGPKPTNGPKPESFMEDRSQAGIEEACDIGLDTPNDDLD